MRCEKCQNDYPSTFYFATPLICKACFEKLPEEEKLRLSNLQKQFTTEQTLEFRARFGKRFLASLVDFLLISVIVLVIYKLDGFLSAYGDFLQGIKNAGTDAETIKLLQNEFFGSNLINLAIPSVLTFFYFLSEAIAGVSLGKYILGLKIASTDGENASSRQLWIRYIVKNSSGVLNLLGIITSLSIINTINSIWAFVLFFGFFLILGRNRQNIQDIIAKTTVFKVDDLEELQNLKEGKIFDAEVNDDEKQ